MQKILDTVTGIARTIVAEESVVADRDGKWVGETMQALKDARITGLVVPEEYGGLGHGLFAIARVCEELGSAYSSAGLCFGMHCVGTAVIAAKATAWQKQQYLEPIAQGAHITTLALSEPGTGAHFYFPQTTLIPADGDDFIVDGGKTFVTNGSHADSYVVSTIGTGDDVSADQFSCIILDEGRAGMTWGAEWDGLGMRGNASRALTLDQVRISGRHILGEKGDQLWYVFNVVAPYFLMAMAGTYLGIAAAAFEEARQCLSQRYYTHSGSSLAQVSLLQHRLGMLWSKLEATRRLIYQAALAGDKGHPDAVLGIMAAKAEVAGCAVDLVNEAMTLAGGRGYRHHSRLSMLFRDARAAHVMSPTTDLLYTWIGRSLLGQPVLSE